MKQLLSLTLLLMLFLSQAEANFFSDLFDGVDEKKEKQFEAVEEEVISADEYFDTSDEPSFTGDEKVFSDNATQDSEEDDSFIKSKNIFLSYLSNPKRVYVNQHFTIEVKAVLTEENLQSISTKFSKGKGYKVLNPHARWKKNAEKSYSNRYTIKLLTAKSKLPDIIVSATNGAGDISQETLKSYAQRVTVLKENNLFSNILAKEFTLLSHHEKKYDEKSNIVVLEINASASNLEDFHLPFASREGIDSITEQGDSQSIYYFATIPNYQKEFKFKYFNLNTNKFIRISFPVVVSDTSVSTQTGLNPHKSKYFFYKVLALLSLSLVLLLLYIRYKKGYLLFLALILAIYTIYSKLITNNLTVPKGVAIQILPTHNSSVFFKTNQAMDVKVLLKKNGFTKVLLPNTKIGWIKDDDLSKN